MSGHLRRAAALLGLIIWTLLLILAVHVARTARHPLRYARYLLARVFRRIPRRDPDGEPLDRDEIRGLHHRRPVLETPRAAREDPDVNKHFLAIALALVTACMLWMTGFLTAGAVKRHDVTSAVSAVIAGALLSAIFLNAAVDLW